MLAAIRHFRLVVLALAIVGLGTGIGVSAAHHSSYMSRSVLQIQKGCRSTPCAS